MQEDHLAHAAHPAADDAREVRALRVEFVFAQAVDELHRQHLVRAGLRMEPRKVHVRIAGEVGAEAEVVIGLVAQIDLLLDGVTEGLDRFRQ